MCAHSLFIKGMTLIKAKTASVLAYLEPVYGIVIAGLLFNEIPGVRVVAGSALILCAVAYASLKSVGTPSGKVNKKIDR